jgi:hypothetical protein
MGQSHFGTCCGSSVSVTDRNNPSTKMITHEQKLRNIVLDEGVFYIRINRQSHKNAPDALITKLQNGYERKCTFIGPPMFTRLGLQTGLALLHTFATAVANNDSENGTPLLVDPIKKWTLPFISTSEGPCFRKQVTFQIDPQQSIKYIPPGILWKDVVKLLMIKEFRYLAHHVSLDRIMPVALIAGVTASDLIEPLLLTLWDHNSVKTVTAKYMELVKYGARPESGQKLFDLIFSYDRTYHRHPDADIHEYEFCDEILAHWKSCGLDVCPDDPGMVVNHVLCSLNPIYLHWFLTNYPHIDLSVPGRHPTTGAIYKRTPYAEMIHCIFNPSYSKETINKMDDVLRKFGRESIIDHSMFGVE